MMEDKAALIRDIQPTYCAIIASRKDAQILVEACLRGNYVSLVRRRPTGKEKVQVSQSGNIFIYEESASGMKRWTDGLSWGHPNRTSNGSTMYRQAELSGRKLIIKREKGVARLKPSPTSTKVRRSAQDVVENGLVKYTWCFTVASTTHRLVSYQSAADALEQRKLQRPSEDPKFFGLTIREELKQSSKIPVGDHGLQDDMVTGNGEYQEPEIPPMIW